MIQIKTYFFYFMIFYHSFAISKNYHEQFEEALQLYKEKRFRLSEQKFKIILEKEKDQRDPVAQLFIAKSQFQQGLWGQARKTCKVLLTKYKNSPYEVNIYTLIGDCSFNEGKITLAFQNYLKARKVIDNLVYNLSIFHKVCRVTNLVFCKSAAFPNLLL